MKLYIDTKLMTFEEDNIEHEIVLRVNDEESYGYDKIIELSSNDKFIKNTFRIEYKKDKEGQDTKSIDYRGFMVRERKTWNSFPLYEIVNGKIVSFNYRQYSYFAETDRRMALAGKINELYNPPSELKTLRKTLKYIMDDLNIPYPDFFEKYNRKIEEVINKNPKG